MKWQFLFFELPASHEIHGNLVIHNGRSMSCFITEAIKNWTNELSGNGDTKKFSSP